MVAIDPIVLTTIVAIPASLISFALFHASRSARRNREERCGNCGGPLYAAGAFAGPSLIQGHLICEPCAAKERRGLRTSLIAAVAISTVTILGLAATALWAPAELGAHPWIPVGAALVEYPVLFAGAVVWMKRMNRRAAQQLGAPQDASLKASDNASQALTAGRVAVHNK